MRPFLKKSLGQHFLIDKNIIKKIINLVQISNKNVVEIGPGDGALTDEIIKKDPKKLILIEKDFKLVKKLKDKYFNNKKIKIFHSDVLKFNVEEIIKKNTIIFGNLPYNISSQILVKFIKFRQWPPKYNDIIFMFQKEVGEKIIGKYPSKDYGRLSILTNYKFEVLNKFLVSPNCFYPKPKVNSLILHFSPKRKKKFNILNINNLEKVTNILFSNKRKMINKNLKKIIPDREIKKIPNLNTKLRPAEIKPEIYYKITEFFEKS
jgi:16S rRNA (adenine1518-N6/adenine1519-N6)-dimethyltransferase